ncbi:MAG: redox-regulated ATPase YchF [Patescibacteria group bacterium]
MSYSVLSIGIVGMPNVGKSTLFKALTKKQIDIQNYPFTTIDPNVGVVAVPDERLELLAKLFNSKKIIPTAIDFIDIAGLVKGASQGEGLGNKFLANIREVDAIAHVVRVFDDKDITHVHNRVDPLDDIEIIKTELELADLQTKEKREKKKGEDLPELDLLSNKKVIYVFNVSEAQLKAGWKPPIDGVVLSSTFELLLSEATPEEQKMYLEDVGIKQSGLDELIVKAYKTLGLLTFLTTGEDETRAWTAHVGDPIPRASRAIHTDFEQKFIRAEVINWKDLLDLGGYAQARATGKLRTVGKDYIIQEGDVVEIKI